MVWYNMTKMYKKILENNSCDELVMNIISLHELIPSIYNALIITHTNLTRVITTITAAGAADVGIFGLIVWPAIGIKNTNHASMIIKLFVSEQAYLRWDGPRDKCLVDVKSGQILTQAQLRRYSSCEWIVIEK